MNPMMVNKRPSMLQSMGNMGATSALPGIPGPAKGLLQPMQSMQPMPEDPPMISSSDGLDDPMAKEADPEAQAKLEAGFLPANMHCETCAHLDNAVCSKYGFPVADEDGCSNGYEAIDAVMDELSGDENGDIEGMESLENQSAPEGELPSNEEEIPEEEESAVTEETPEVDKSNKGGKKNINSKGGMR